jgi:hypothetical protein
LRLSGGRDRVCALAEDAWQLEDHAGAGNVLDGHAGALKRLCGKPALAVKRIALRGKDGRAR